MIQLFTLVIVLILFCLLVHIYLLANQNSCKSHYQGKISGHFDGKKFHNYRRNKTLLNNYAIINCFLGKIFGKVCIWPKEIVVQTTNAKNIVYNSQSDFVFFINHSTTLISLSQYNILTDPIWSNHASPLKFIGPKRRAAPGVKFSDLPEINLVLISHNHYDHLDYYTVKMLTEKHNPIFLVGLGVGGNLLNMGIKKNRIIELDWWENHIFSDPELTNKTSLEVTFVPAQHFSSRFLDDKNATLWGGFVIRSSNKKIYFAGDTGYDNNLFGTISKKMGDIDVSILPIGAYKPDSFRYVHINPEEAVKISQIIKSKINIPVHYGTFILSFESYEEPLNDLKQALKKNNLALDRFKILKNGEYIDLDCELEKKHNLVQTKVTKIANY